MGRGRRRGGEGGEARVLKCGEAVGRRGWHEGPGCGRRRARACVVLDHRGLAALPQAVLRAGQRRHRRGSRVCRHRRRGYRRPRRLRAEGSRSEEHTSELQSLMRISYAVFCLKKKKKNILTTTYK